ncbi:C-5 cytosine methyltransferase [Penicillium brevicompactum]|uniref:C-5 cytosine methyltransferase n=1 Tax=Penicillium brevicompactum TaxID=5074 RepID=UPI002540BFB4|nr:C-5 cytosine methyltransferase [Penicillium brevicompactum]KAJ5325232.1 C-5 cytosine methyltransferase [Penicillium brevicompactum]
MSRTQAEDVRMEIDLTGDDDIVEQDMSNLSLSAKDSPCLNAETYDSVARALHDTFSRNFTSSLNAFSPSSLFHNSPQLQSIPDSPVNGLHTHRDIEVDLDSQTIDLGQTNQSRETSIQLLTPPQTVCESTVTDPAMEMRNAAGQEIHDLTQDKELSLPEYYYKGIFYRAGMCVEFKDHSFMKIVDIIPQPDSDDLRFFGRRLYRSTHKKCDSYLPKFNRELIWVTQNTDLMSSRYVKRILDICFTNFRTDFSTNPRDFTCRLKLTLRSAGVIIAPGRAPITADQTAIEWLQYKEADPGHRLWSNELRAQWRGETVPFGAAEKSSQALEMEQKTRIIDLESERTYTFGDTFCGGGGVSCGAKEAGLRLIYANDMEQKALDTYVLNHSDVDTECSDFHDFITNTKRDHKVDIAHASPPCQTWSPAHTVDSANDDANSACVFTGVDLARVSKCRILTLEETNGLPTRFPLFFNRIILSLVEIGYSVRWSVLGCDNYGVPQERKRVIIIAAGPGEVLPHFADLTHGVPGPNILPRATIASTISQIPDDAPNHNLERAYTQWRFSHRQSFPPESLAKTITCGGGEFNYHPSGERPYTEREMAVLQTFPLDYKFAGVYTRKQIGNAVPPLFAKAIYGEVVRSLRETDQAELEGRFR